jgi:hypothetical protein
LLGVGSRQALKNLGVMPRRDEWIAPPCRTTPATAEADAMHTMLVLRADALTDCTENSVDARELAMITEPIEAFETNRWPHGKAPGGRR